MGVPGLCAGVHGPVAIFVSSDFKSAYPSFATLADAQLNEAFNLATIYLRNDGTSPVSTVPLQTTLLYQLTAHLAQIMYGANGEGPAGIVGRVNSASEGSTSVGADWPANANNAWFLQTPYGANFWQATAAYRIAHYVPGPTRFGNGIGGRACYVGGGRRRF